MSKTACGKLQRFLDGPDSAMLMTDLTCRFADRSGVSDGRMARGFSATSSFLRSQGKGAEMRWPRDFGSMQDPDTDEIEGYSLGRSVSR
ncbi:hypothetical protein [Paracoccus lutimaris]|uniref:hypothetical protein n=1 Tax=Paracoccus lutimaris TaxID=1490030 RepID=UPI000DF17553|nr:hypothetical protein [Paracoccus lutimaris]